MAEDPAIDGKPAATAGDRASERRAAGRDPGDPGTEGTAEPSSADAREGRGVDDGPEYVEVDVPSAETGVNRGDDRGLAAPEAVADAADPEDRAPEDVRNYARFSKMDGATYERVNGFLRDRTYITAREWAIARLCADFRTETGVEMTKIGDHLPELVPFMTDTYSPQAVNQARHSFEEKVTKAGATFLYGAMCDFFTSAELDDLMYEVTEVAKFLLEVEGAELSVDEELDTEERIMEVMREVRHSSRHLRAEEVGPVHERCPHCGHDLTQE